MVCVLASPAAAGRLRLLAENDATSIQASVLKPFDAVLVAERDTAAVEMSAVAYTMELPEGVLIASEEILVESLLSLGTSTEGVNVVFRCAEGPRLAVLRFRFVATRPIAAGEIRLLPETRTKFLGIVACRDEDFGKDHCQPSSLSIRITAP